MPNGRILVAVLPHTHPQLIPPKPGPNEMPHMRCVVTPGDQEPYRDTDMSGVQRRYSRGYAPQYTQAMAHTHVVAGDTYMFVIYIGCGHEPLAPKL